MKYLPEGESLAYDLTSERYLPGFSWSGKGSLGCWGTPASSAVSSLGETKGVTILIANAISGSGLELLVWDASV